MKITKDNFTKATAEAMNRESTQKLFKSYPINGSWNVMNAYPYKESDAER